MLVIYDSMTGNVKRFINELNLNAVQIHENLIVNEPFVLITYTIGFGEVPNSTLNFLDNNHQYLRGVASSGNRNFGSSFANAASVISQQYNVSLLLKFELSGTKQDIEKFIQEVNHIDRNTNS
jgi:protein involved in ribonucleotide reduction